MGREKDPRYSSHGNKSSMERSQLRSDNRDRQESGRKMSNSEDERMHVPGKRRVSEERQTADGRRLSAENRSQGNRRPVRDGEHQSGRPSETLRRPQDSRCTTDDSRRTVSPQRRRRPDGIDLEDSGQTPSVRRTQENRRRTEVTEREDLQCPSRRSQDSRRQLDSTVPDALRQPSRRTQDSRRQPEITEPDNLRQPSRPAQDTRRHPEDMDRQARRSPDRMPPDGRKPDGRDSGANRVKQQNDRLKQWEIDEDDFDEDGPAVNVRKSVRPDRASVRDAAHAPAEADRNRQASRKTDRQPHRDSHKASSSDSRSHSSKRQERYFEESEEWDAEDKGSDNPVIAFFQNLTAMDKIVGLTGLAVCVAAVITISIFAGMRSLNKQIEAFAPMGQNLAQLSVTGESALLAVGDAQAGKEMAADPEESDSEETGYNEKDDESTVSVGLNLTSVEKDLKIKFVNRKTGKLIAHADFQVEIKGPNDTLTKNDDDGDGIIYLTKMTPGKYTVRITGPDKPEEYTYSADGQEITVKDKIEYKKIDVSDEVKTEKEVNVSKEDTAKAPPVESVLQDTVEWVESTKTAVGTLDGGAEYVEIKKSDISDPSNTARVTYEKCAAQLPAGVFAAKPWMFTALSAAVSPLDRPDEGSARTTTGEVTPPTESPQPDPKPDPDPKPENIPVTGVTISSTSLSLKAGESAALSATVQPDNATNKKVTWSSSAPEVASVNGGSVTANQEGTATITVKTEDGGLTATADVKVTSKSVPVESVTITGASPVETGGTITLTAAVSPSNATDSNLNWSSGDTKIATVDSSGKVTGVAAGKTTITVTAGGKSATANIEVTAKAVKLESIKINSSVTTVKVNASIDLTVTATPKEASAAVTWNSSNTGIATVDSSGRVTGKAAGSAVITAASTTDITKTDKITITVAAQTNNSLSLDSLGKMTAGETKNANAKISDANGKLQSVKYTCSDTKYATIDGNGNIKAIRTGKVRITVEVRYSNNATQSASSDLEIVPAKSNKVTIDPTSATLKVGDTIKFRASVDTSGYTGVLWYSSDQKTVSIEEHGDGTAKALKPGKVTITACSSENTDVKVTSEITVSGTDPRSDTRTPLKDKNGNQLYYKDGGGKFIAAVLADYYKYNTFYKKSDNVEYKYTGWQTIDGKRYYFDKNGVKVTGDQVIQGVKYTFGGDGAISSGAGNLGIDVSKHNGNIDWNQVKASGVNFVIIRCGYRGSSTGALIEDPKFRVNAQGAANAGIKVGIYFFTQAINEIEAVEEASMTLSLIKNYKISYPVFLDVEASGGRADGLNAATRTAIVNAYCRTIQNGGYTAGVYANKTWLNSYLNASALSGYKIWLAQYAAAPTYGGKYDMWQYSSTGTIGGISGKTDLNISFF